MSDYKPSPLHTLVCQAVEMPPRPRQLKPLLLHSTRRVEIQVQRKAHRKACAVCEQLPTGYRMVVTEGSGRAAKNTVLCSTHGQDLLTMVIMEHARALALLAGNEKMAKGLRI